MNKLKSAYNSLVLHCKNEERWTKKCLLLAIMICLIFPVVACGKEEKGIDGYWKATEIDFSDSLYLNTHKEFKQTLEDILMDTAIQLNPDGTGISNYSGDFIDEITWKEKENEYILLSLPSGASYFELYNASKEDSLIL